MIKRKQTWIVLTGICLLVFGNDVFGRPGPDGFHGPRPLIIPPLRRIIIRPPHGIIIEPTIILGSPKPVEPVTPETVTIWITNDNGSKTSVILVKDIDGPGYTGPKGEYYSNMPTEEQLKILYGMGTTAKKPELTVWITNDNGSMTPVTLTPTVTGFFGPSGEYYPTMPTEEQLQALYGLHAQDTSEDSITIWLDKNGTKIPVVLKKEGTEYIGPNGEHYASVPTKEQLAMIYGKKAQKVKSDNVTIWIENGDESKTPITLKKEGSSYIGPAGETYSSLPTKEQLTLLYGSEAEQDEQTELNFVITNEKGKEVIVTLEKDGSEFVGPKGERYPDIPTEEQLKMIYGK